MKRILGWVVAGIVLTVLVYTLIQISCHPSLSKLKSQGDSLGGVYSRDTATYWLDTLRTDSVLVADSAKPTTRHAVKTERASAKRVIKTAEAQKKNYQQQIKALTPTLRLFAEVDYGISPDTAGAFSASAGLALRLKQDFDAQLFARQQFNGRATLNIGVRKNWRLF
jgi:hypothetical protein